MAGKARANARLIAAAGSAASELPEEYDPGAAVGELPRLLGALQTIAKADGTRYAGTDALQHVAEKVLDAIQIDTSETDE
jgi:MoxR-like ATPase